MEKEYATTDLALAAFLLLKGIELLRHEKNGNKTRFIFDDEVDLCEHLHVAFANSDFQKYDSNIRLLKKLVHS